MWLMLQQENPDDFVIATGTAYSVRDFLKASFDEVNLDWEKYTKYDSKYERPTEVDALIGDAAKAQDQLGWKYKTNALDMARLMVRGDLALLECPGVKIPDASFNYWKI